MDIDYQQALQYMQDLQSSGWQLGLERIENLLELLNNPHKKTTFVHIAGTNGKSTTASMYESVLRQAGYKTGLFTSPHLIDVRETIRINGEMISCDDFLSLVNAMRPHIEAAGTTFFESLTALAFMYFAQSQVDVVVLETGLGGRDDATNVVTPLLSVITSIDLEHTVFLGNSVEEIAEVKAGIIKKNVPCIIGELPRKAEQVIQAICKQKNSKMYRANKVYSIESVVVAENGTKFAIRNTENKAIHLQIPFPGPQFARNAGIVAASFQICEFFVKITDIQLVSGLQTAGWSGRFQLLRKDPPVILDVAHNTSAFFELVQVVNEVYSQLTKVFVMGLLADKDVDGICKTLVGTADQVYIVPPDSKRAIKSEMIVEKLMLYKIPVEVLSIEKALQLIFSDHNAERMYCITGSHYVAGKVLKLINNLTS